MRLRFVLCALLIALCACDREGASHADAPSTLSVVIDSSAGEAFVLLRGLSRSELQRLGDGASNRSDSAWQSLLRLSVADTAHASVAISGRYAVSDSAVEFRPRYPFDAGRLYLATVRPRALGLRENDEFQDSVFTTSFALPTGDNTPRTVVTAVHPSADTLPENLLRLYIDFSAPMSRVGGIDFISLRDARGVEVKNAFLPLDADFWNDDRTRYTAFLDPGRVKRGILPNEQMGRAILAGRRYHIIIDSTWRDARGVPLTASYRHDFVVAPPDEKIVATTAWRIDSPQSASTAALRVHFPKPLDHGLLLRALGVETVDGQQVLGDVTLANDDREWRFTPREPWLRGDYRLLVLSILEDPAGNRTDRPFEVDVFDRVDQQTAPERRLIPFVVR